MLENFTWQSPGYQIERQPIGKVDYNVSTKHRASFTYNWQVVDPIPTISTARTCGFRTR